MRVPFGPPVALIFRVMVSRSLLRIRESAKAFARVPGLSLALLITIALGIGSNAAIFGFLRGLTHPTSALKDSNRIVSIFSSTEGPLSLKDYQLLKNNPGVFEWIG